MEHWLFGWSCTRPRLVPPTPLGGVGVGTPGVVWVMGRARCWGSEETGISHLFLCLLRFFSWGAGLGWGWLVFFWWLGLLVPLLVGGVGGCWLLFENCTVDASISDRSLLPFLGLWVLVVIVLVFCVCEVL